jgi:tRNA threonylcarbamoyladenosine biosynthesis protein TsaB
MLALLMNTCGMENMVALAGEARVLAAEALPARGSSEEMLPALRRLFAGCGRVPAELTAVVVAIGPGSFTGVRAGLSTAKGLCEACGCGMIALSRLALLAGDADGETLALLDAGRGEFFCGFYRAGEILFEELLLASEVRARMAGRRVVACEAAVAAALGPEVALVPEPGTETMLEAARRRLAAGVWSDVALVDANYLRRTDAERAMVSSGHHG